MVESFGMPILKYQSEEFDIMEIWKHFEEDILFTNIIMKVMEQLLVWRHFY